jgi:hypothetical protein
MVDGEATPPQVAELRPHLRRCSGCRATVRELHKSAASLAAILPVPVTVLVERRGVHVPGLLSRLYEALAGGFHERVGGSVVKFQAAIDAAGSGKVAAVAASAAAVAGGGFTAVDRVLEHTRAPESRATAGPSHHHIRAHRATQRKLSAVITRAPTPAVVTRPKPAPVSDANAAAEEFGFEAVSASAGRKASGSSSTASQPAAGKGAEASAASSEFGG